MLETFFRIHQFLVDHTEAPVRRALMDEIEKRGAKIVKITLHVGAGTWMPVKTENLNEHKMHSEW